MRRGGERGSRFRSFPGHRPEGLRSTDYGYLGGREDHRRPREGVRVTAAPLEDPPCAGPTRGLLGPGPELLDEDRPLDRWSHEHLGTAQHTCGTVPRGPVDGPEHAAVDQFGRVHGVRGPRVADTSVPPDTPHRGPAATAVLTGELIAGAIRLDLLGAGRDPGSRGRPDPASPPAANTASSVATGPPLPGRNRPAAGQPSGRSRSHEGASPIRCRMTSEPRKVS
ncbi:GMC oxidoreductase [Streptomyces viridosporus]